MSMISSLGKFGSSAILRQIFEYQFSSLFCSLCLLFCQSNIIENNIFNYNLLHTFNSSKTRELQSLLRYTKTQEQQSHLKPSGFLRQPSSSFLTQYSQENFIWSFLLPGCPHNEQWGCFIFVQFPSTSLLSSNIVQLGICEVLPPLPISRNLHQKHNQNANTKIFIQVIKVSLCDHYFISKTKRPGYN